MGLLATQVVIASSPLMAMLLEVVVSSWSVMVSFVELLRKNALLFRKSELAGEEVSRGEVMPSG